MYKKFTSFLMVLVLLGSQISRADEGMWLLSLIQKYNIAEMQKMGFKLTAEDIYSINQASLKDAVGALDYGSCTAELISAQGLLLTNHHCGYGEIQEHSSTSNDYLSDGFWAKDLKDELPNPGKTVSFLVRMADVTERVMAAVDPELSGQEREMHLQVIVEGIKAEATEGTHYDAQVRSFFNGNQYFLFVLETFLDVRLVGAPPESIGKFGHDTDNWMWPRHTGDFAIFRVYTAPDGTPAEYSKKNVPYQPKKHLPISLKGIEEDDFAMVLGFPGTTERYLTSHGVLYNMEVVNPIRIEVRTEKERLMKEAMDTDPETRIKYAAKFAQSSNYRKYSIGQNKGLEALNVVAKKQAEEAKLTKWINQNQTHQEEYGTILDDIKSSYEDSYQMNVTDNYMNEAIFGGPEIIMFSYWTFQLYDALHNEKPKKEIKELAQELKERGENYYKDYDAQLDQKLVAALFEIFKKGVNPDFLPPVFQQIESEYSNNFAAYADAMFKTSFLADQEKFNAFCKKPAIETIESDMAFQAMLSIVSQYRGLYMIAAPIMEKLELAQRKLIKAKMEMEADKNFYPDANSTMRLTYGVVGDYEPQDAVVYKYYTTLKGVMEKEDPSNPEFMVSDKLKQLYQQKNYGDYAHKLPNGDVEMRVCFTTNNDITGGNSGSPVINGNGELIGVAFDGNWEAMSGDIAFEPDIQKCINVDIRYVLFIIEKFAGAKHLIEEMTIIK